MGLKLVTAPAEEPVTVDEAKLQTRVDGTEEDVLFEALIGAAREQAEAITRRALITQTWDYTLDEWPKGDYIELPMPPLQSVTSIKYKDTSGVEATWSPANYIVDIARDPGRVALVYGGTWPTTTLYPTSAITIRFVAGYGLTGGSVPQKIRQAILLMVGHLYENREATGQANLVEIPLGATALLWPERVLRYF